MLEQIIIILQQKCFLDPQKPVLIGVSGGGDSLCLLDLLTRSGYPVVVAHFNHALRAEAAADARFVEGFAGKLGLPFVLGQADVFDYAQTVGLSVEEAARHLRYTFLFEKAHQVGAQAVAVAHQADDQVETILMHLLRGSGLSGLRGMRYWTLPRPWSEEIPLVRPLLEFWREEIDAYLWERNIEPVVDKTNRDTTIFRNRLRHELVPYLSTYNTGIRQVIWRMGKVLDSENELVEGMVDSAWEETYTGQGDGYLSFRYHVLSMQPKGLQRRLIRRGISLLRPGLRDVDFSTTELALDFLDTPTKSGRLVLAAGLMILLEEELLWLADQAADLPRSFWPQLPSSHDGCKHLTLELPGVVRLEHGWVLACDLNKQVEPAYRSALDNTDMFQAWIDASKVRFPLTIRCRRPGERFYPAGLAGRSVKVSDFMINVKMPARARANWPLVFSDDEMVWIPGYRLAQASLVSDSTAQVAHLHLFKMDET
jgi:tRNA(Ile)-lysidine synthase